MPATKKENLKKEIPKKEPVSKDTPFKKKKGSRSSTVRKTLVLQKKEAEKRKKPKKKEEPIVPKKYYLQGELEIAIVPSPSELRATDKSYSTLDWTQDKNGQLFHKGTVILNIEGDQEVVFLSSAKVRMLLNILGVTSYAEV